MTTLIPLGNYCYCFQKVRCNFCHRFFESHFIRMQSLCLTLYFSISEEDSDDDEDDDELELQAELERIKAERAAAQAKKEAEEQELLAKKKESAAITGNPLLQLDVNESAKVIHL